MVLVLPDGAVVAAPLLGVAVGVDQPLARGAAEEDEVGRTGVGFGRDAVVEGVLPVGPADVLVHGGVVENCASMERQQQCEHG